MSLFRLDDARPLGTGLQTGPGAVNDAGLAAQLATYKRLVAGGYRAVAPDELEAVLPDGPALISQKIDGEMWFLVLDGSDVALANPRGRVLAGALPVLDEARSLTTGRLQGRTVLAGELWAAPMAGGRPRSSGLAAALSGGDAADVRRVAFSAFDVVVGAQADPRAPMPDYATRLEFVRRVTEGGRRLRVVATDGVNSVAEIRRQYTEKVEEGRAEGLVVRARDERTYKLKPVLDLDAVVVGYTGRVEAPDVVRSLLLAVVREDGSFQLIGSLGNLGDDEVRRAILQRVEPLAVESSYRHASRAGAFYRFVRPELVVELRVTDIQATDSEGDVVERMVLEFRGDSGWVAVRKAPGVSLYAPRWSRFRDDKGVNAQDAGVAQLLDRCTVQEVDLRVSPVNLDRAEVVLRRVWVKDGADPAVRKLLVVRTHKEERDPRHPPFVVLFTDYSPTRKEPLQRFAHPAPDKATALGLGDELLVDRKVISEKTGQLTRGWREA